MANVKDRYAEVTRAAKQVNASANRASTQVTDPNSLEEARLFGKFRARAREDFRTLGAKTPRRD